MKLTPKQKDFLTLLSIVVFLTFMSTFFGVRYPLPYDEITARGTTHFTNLQAEDITATDDLAVTDDAAVGGDLAITGATTAGSDITFASGTTLGEAVDTVLDLSEFLAFTEQTIVVVGAGLSITPTGTYQPITSTAAVTTSTTTAIISGTVNGQLLVLANENASDAIIIDDGANTALGGNKTLTGGQGDAIWLMWDGADWICIGYNDN